MMIDSGLNSSKSKLELKLIGPQSSRNQNRSSNNQITGNSSISNSNQINYNGGYNTSRTPQNVTPKRQNSNHTGTSINQGSISNQNNLNLGNVTNNYGSLIGSATPTTSLNTQINNRLQGNSYLNKANNNGGSLSKLSNQNFAKKNGGLGSNLGTTKSTLNTNVNSGNNNNCGYGASNNANQNNGIQGSSFSKDKMNAVMKNNLNKQKVNSNMHVTHKNQILQQYQASQQQFIQQQLGSFSYMNGMQQQQSSMNNLLDSSPNPHLSPSTSQKQILSNDNSTKIKNSYLSSKPTSPHSFLGNNESASTSTKNMQKYSQQMKESGFFNNPFSQGLSVNSNTSKSNKCMTPINEKNKNNSNSFLKKSQLVVTKNQNNSNQLNTSTNINNSNQYNNHNNSNTSFLKQSHSRSPLNTNQIEKENTYLNHFDTSTLSIHEKSKRGSHIQQTNNSQSHLQSSPFSYLSSGQSGGSSLAPNACNSSNLNNLSGISKSKSSKSPKQSNSLQMVTQSLETPSGNFFTSHLSRKKNLSTVNYNSFSQNMEKQQSSGSSSQQNQQQSYTMSTQHNFDSSPISNARRINQFNKNESSDMIQSNGQNSFLLSSNIKDNLEYTAHNKTHDYGQYGKNSGFLSNYPNSSRFEQYRSVDGCDGQTSRSFFPKSYLNMDAAKESAHGAGGNGQKKKNATLDGGDLLNGIKQNYNGLSTDNNNFITMNEQELSFQNDQDDNLMMLMNQQNNNTTNIQAGNSYCYGYYNDDESNFLNSTNFLNLTNLQINTQNNTMIAGNNNNGAYNINSGVQNKNSSANTSQIILQNQNSYQNGNQQVNSNQFNLNNNTSIQQNNTLNWTNSTNLFNNSVCAGSMLNTTINNILQNMNSTQSGNNTLHGNNNTNMNNHQVAYMNSNNTNAKAAPNIYSSLSQQNGSNSNATNTNANNTPTNLNHTNSQNNNFTTSSTSATMNNVSVPVNSNTDKLPLDTTPKQVAMLQEPAPYKNKCTTLKSILYDNIMPTIKPITRQFKLLNSHQYNNSQSSVQMSMNYNNNSNNNGSSQLIGSESVSNQNKQMILNSLTKQFSSNNLCNNNSSSNLNVLNTSITNINNNANSIVETNNGNKLNQYGNNPFSFDESKQQSETQYSEQLPSSNFLERNDGTQQNQLLGESQNSNQATPIKIHLKVDSQSVNSFHNNFQYNQGQSTPVLKSPSNKSGYDLNIGTPVMKSPSNKKDNSSSPQQLTPTSQGKSSKVANSNNPQIIVSSEKDQISLQQYNFSFSNCVNQQKKLQQQQQQQLQQSIQLTSQQQQQQSIQLQQQIIQNNFLHPSKFIQSPVKKSLQQLSSDKKKNQGSSSKKKNLLIHQEHKLVESSKQEYSSSPEKPVINLLLSQQITVVEGISQVSSQMFQMEHSDPYGDQSLLQNFWSIDSFQIGKCLGRGRFGNVYLSRHKLTNMLFAIKQINKKNLIESCMEKQLQQEIKIQTYLNHPNILKMLGFFDDDQKIYLILELASHGDIYKEIKRETNKKFTEEKAANYIRQVCEGLIYLHSQGIIHRDIKPENILNSYGVLKLSDFGWSIYTEEKRMTFCGTLDYVSPEVVSGKDYDFKVDIWSIGVLTYELITGKPPFENRQNHNEAYQKILQVKYDFPNYISKEVKDFMSKLLVGDPNKRISLETALNHEWIIKNTRNCLADWDPKVSEESLYLLK